MAQDETKPIGPDLSQGISLDQLADGKMLVGHVGGEDVLLVRRGQDIFAVGAHCAHYHGPLVDGLVVGDTVRCPWHHACFDLRTGEALAAPALSPIACWPVEQRDGKIWVSEKREPTAAKATRQNCRQCARKDRHRWRRGRWVRRSRNASAGTLPGQHCHAEQRRCVALRPTKPFQGLSRRQRSIRLRSFAPGELLS